MFKILRDWLQQRTGYQDLLHSALDEPVRGGARWSYVFGSALLVTLLIQMVTGVALGAYYSPSTTDAWASVNYIQTQVYLGWLLRGMHHFGASAMVILVVLHMIQTVWYGAFRAPREVNWLAGLVLLQVVLAFALTGYLLPWDQKGYWATQVATSIIGTLPVIGEPLQELVQGGKTYGNLTLTRFYAMHVFVLPAVVILFTVAHVYLFRRHGVTVPPSLSEDEADKLTEPFYPRQLLKDAVFALVILVAIVGLSVLEGGAPLAAPADPSSQYLARPEWYFLPLFQLLKYFEGELEIFGTVVLPGVAMGFLFLMPFLHTLLRRWVPSTHKALSFLFLGGLMLVGGLGVLAVVEDAGNPMFEKLKVAADQETSEAARLAKAGVPSRGPLFLHENDPVVWGMRVATAKCVTCHHPCDKVPYKGDPCLADYASRAWLTRVIREPRHALAFGNTSIDDMEPYSGPEEALVAIVEFVYSQGNREDVNPNLAANGATLFESEGCGSCHNLDGTGSGLAPDLQGYASEAWLAAFIRTPGAPRFYGEMNQMDDFGHEKLSNPELDAVVKYLRSLSKRGAEYP